MDSVVVVVPGVTPQGDANVPRTARKISASSVAPMAGQALDRDSPGRMTKLLLQSTAVMVGAVVGVVLPGTNLAVPRWTLTPLSNSATYQETLKGGLMFAPASKVMRLSLRMQSWRCLALALHALLWQTTIRILA